MSNFASPKEWTMVTHDTVVLPAELTLGITKSEAVIKINKRLGFNVVPYSALTTDEKFWKGCDTCPHYQELLDNDYADCQCTGLLFV